MEVALIAMEKSQCWRIWRVYCQASRGVYITSLLVVYFHFAPYPLPTIGHEGLG